MPASTEPQAGVFSRRRFFRWASSLAAAVGAAPWVSSAKALSSPDAPANGEDYYAKLSVTPIINAAGTYTTLTAACMPPEVLAAVQKAALHPVRLRDLQQKAGEYIARRLKCEGAVVTSGASGAISLAAAACLQYANNIDILDMPQAIDGKKNQVIVQRAHRYEYDRAMYLCGARVTEVVTLDHYKRACAAGNAVMTNFFNAAEDEDGIAGSAQIGREEWLQVAHEYKIPCHLDAAADMPPIENLWKYTGMGFDLVAFSGGKGIRGPQNAGLLLGRKALTDLAVTNNNPNSDAVGRGMKVAKEQLVGMVAAVDWLLEQSDEKNQAEYMRQTDIITNAVKDVPTMKTRVFMPPIANHVPHLLLSYDPSIVGITTKQVQESLRAKNPSIELNPATGTSSRVGIPSDENTIVIATWMLQPGEAEIVGRSLKAVLTKNHA